MISPPKDRWDGEVRRYDPLYNGVRIIDRGPDLTNIRLLDQGIIPMLVEMKRHGVLVDLAHMNSLRDRLTGERDEIGAKITQLLGSPLNPASADQCARLFFGDMGLRPIGEDGKPKNPKLTKSKSRFAADDETLSMIADQHPAAKMVLEWRGLNKIVSTYVGPIGSYLDPDGRLRCNWNYTRTETGRLSSSNPNMQNWPSHGPIAEAIRNGFVARSGYRLVSLDLSQIEMRVGADNSQDDGMIEAFWQDQDLHTVTAARIFFPEVVRSKGLDVAMSLVDKKKHRLPSKTLNFSIFYGVTPPGLQKNIVLAGGDLWPIEKVEGLISDWFTAYEGARRMIEQYHQWARVYGMVWDMWGRLRYIPQVRSQHDYIRSAGFRECGNMPIQAGAQGLLKLAMAEIMEIVYQYRDGGYGVYPLLQIHDELVFEVEKDIAEPFALDCQGIMEAGAALRVPVKAEYGIGERWGELK